MLRHADLDLIRAPFRKTNRLKEPRTAYILQGKSKEKQRFLVGISEKRCSAYDTIMDEILARLQNGEFSYKSEVIAAVEGRINAGEHVD